MIRRRISLTRILEVLMFTHCPQATIGTRLSCLVAERPCQC